MMTIQERIAAMSVPANATIRQAMEAIDRSTLGMAFLMDERGALQHVVTDGDIRRALLGGKGLDSPAKAVALPSFTSATVDTSSEELQGMFSEKIRIIPLLDNTGKIVDLAMFDTRVHLPVAAPVLGMEELQNVSECVLSGWVSSAGKFVTEFEKQCAEYCGTKEGIATSNGTTALHLTMLALGVGPGDEVIIPALTFIATANAVTYTGATPVFVDSEESTWNIDPAKIEAAITERTKAIIPVHLYGHPADMDPIMSIARKHTIAVVEDAAEAHGAEYKGKRVGGIGTMGIFSFYGNKIITTGEGGMIVTNDAELARKMRVLRDHGMTPEQRYIHHVLGYNYRLTNLQAAVGVAQMKKIDQILEKKRQIADAYTERLRGMHGVTLPPEADWAKNVFWMYSILLDPAVCKKNRDEVADALRSDGIESRPVFPSLHMQPIYKTGQSLPVAEKISAMGLSLPSGVGMSIEDIERVCACLKRSIGA